MLGKYLCGIFVGAVWMYNCYDKETGKFHLFGVDSLLLIIGFVVYYFLFYLDFNGIIIGNIL